MQIIDEHWFKHTLDGLPDKVSNARTWSWIATRRYLGCIGSKVEEPVKSYQYIADRFKIELDK